MGRRRYALYAGAVGRLDFANVNGLAIRYQLQPKVDGIYAVVSIGADRSISGMFTRTSAPVPKKLLSEFEGVTFADPDSILVGELEAWTEAANRHAEGRGFRLCWLFDVLRLGGRDLTCEPYSVRRDALMRSVAGWQEREPDRTWKRDQSGFAHDLETGRFTDQRTPPSGWRRLPVVPQLPARSVDEAWADWVDAGDMPAEGLVAVAQDAPIGRRRSKLKLKRVTSIDAVCLEADQKAARMLWREAGLTFIVGRRKGIEMSPGRVFEIRHEGFYERTNQPRFARVLRERLDLTGGPNG